MFLRLERKQPLATTGDEHSPLFLTWSQVRCCAGLNVNLIHKATLPH
jgi:hypothetical protein